MINKGLGLARCASMLIALAGCDGGSGTSATAASSQGSSTGSSGAELSSTGGGNTGSAGSTASGTSGARGSSTSSGVSSGGSGGSCHPDSGLGGQCTTTADCELHSGLICSSDHGEGICTVPTIPVVGACAPLGAPCDGADSGCCGICFDGGCRDFQSSPCQDYPGAPCSSSTPCCELLNCTGETCQPTCGQENAICNPDAGNGDCCIGLGYTCEPTIDGGSVYECNNIYAVIPGGGCIPGCAEGDREQCELGSPCDPDHRPDNCGAAGLACDPNLDVCTRPYSNDACIQGGPPCVGNSYFLDSLADMACVVVPQAYAKPVCVQSCQSTNDCVDPSTYCCTTCYPPACIPSYLSMEPCQFFQPCDTQESNDGLCAPYTASGASTVGWCLQATHDGGGPGSSCDTYATRENPAFCDTADWCIAGLCMPICNAGVNGGGASSPPGPFCSNADTQECVSAFGQIADDSDLGFCLTTCDLFAIDGGSGCPSASGGSLQGCFPLAVIGLDDQLTGGCLGVAGSAARVGQVCTQPAGGPSACEEGSLCYPEPNGGSFCDAICQLHTECGDGSSCQAYELAPGYFSSVTGVCFTGTSVDGG